LSERDTPETDEHYRAHFAEHDHNRRLCKRLERQRDEFKIWWERDSKALSVALGQRDTARAVAEDNRARYAVAERQRDELAEALRDAQKWIADREYGEDWINEDWFDGSQRAVLKRIDSILARIDAASNERGRG
jgi:hypothetical protein